MENKDAFDLWWEWVEKPLDSPLTIDAEIHDAVMAMPPDERRDRTKVNEAVREGLRLGPLRPAGSAMQRKTQSDLENGLKVGDRIRLIAESLAWKAEMTLQGQVGEVIERRDDGRLTIRYNNGRLLMGQEPESFERVPDIGLRAKGK